MTAPITSNGPITTRLHHYAGRYSYRATINERMAALGKHGL